MTRELTAIERQTLDAYAAKHGRNWKQSLQDAWYNASEPGILQALRNDPAFGPRGLINYVAKRDERIKVVCNECGKKFQVRVYADTCPKCGGADIDVR